MSKNFDDWNIHKKAVHATAVDLFCHEREVWWSTLGINIGTEQDGKGEFYSRPVLILKVFANGSVVVVPLTTSSKKNPFYFSLGTIAREQSFAIVSQIKTIDKRRLRQKIDTVPHSIFDAVITKIKKTIFP
jgi:mRNA interferase MazF